MSKMGEVSPEAEDRTKSGKQRAATHSFQDLACWQACRELRIFVAKKVVPTLPAPERFRLGDQLLRSARSTTANIAEGYGRYHYLDEAKFCGISRGSCYEVIDHLITGNDEDQITDDLLEQGEAKALHAIKILNGYMAYLKRRATEPK
jgi:four helix bundle protein